MIPDEISIGNNTIVLTSEQKHGLIILALMGVVGLISVGISLVVFPNSLLGYILMAITVAGSMHLTGVMYSKYRGETV